jgi:phenylacetate-coenzyme A ligase PaaK-like adenylate-forming protein
MMAFGSEPLTVEMRERIFEAWGIDPGEYYATTEAATIASSTPEHPRALEIFEDQYVIEIVDEANRPVAPGTAGAKVLVTNLENRTLPLISYELADRVIESPEPNPAGRPYRHLAGIDGRTAGGLEVRLVLDPGAPADTPERVRMAVIRALPEAGAVPPAVAVTSVERLEREFGPAAKLKLIVSRR